MENVNSVQQFQRLKLTIEQEERDIKSLEENIRRKGFEHRHAKEAFEKIDKEMKELENKKNQLVSHRTSLHVEFSNMQREIESLNRRSGITIKK
jgi:chromosome segregation ATPase